MCRWKFLDLRSSLLIFLASFTGMISAQDAPRETPAKPKDERLDRETPEGTLRLFLLGVSAANADVIKGTAGPLPDEQLKLLLTPPPQGGPSKKELIEHCAALKVQRLKVGDKFTLPGNREITIPAADVTDDKLVLLFEGSPVPTRMAFIKGLWWVDAGPTIAARRAAAEIQARKAAEAGR